MKLKIVLFFLAFSCSCGLLVQGTFYSCPEIPQDMVGICSDECTDDSDCENETKCCSNGCGHVCKVPVRIPYYDPPLECPDLSGNQNAGICEEDCSDNTECTNEGELCCSNGCGTACMEAVLVSPRCSAVRDQVLNGTALIGPYIPQCEDDGNFSPTQCWGSTGSCWCVDTQSGEPVSDMIRFKEPQCAKEDPVFFSCPPLESDVAGACAEMCSGDSDCENGQKCCSNGCGHSCRDPMSIPYISPPLTCPERDTLTGICDMPPCEESNCPKGSFCCENPCGGKMCAEGVRRCSAIQQQMANTTDHLFGAFEPQCNSTTGKFQSVQCHSHYCWCVNPDDGKPTSEVVLSEKMKELDCTEPCPIEGQVYMECGSACPPTCANPNPACITLCVKGCQCPTGMVLDEDANKCIDPDDCDTGCTYNGQTYANGETFPDKDNCNTCTCFGSSVTCTEMACVPGCTHNGHFYEEGEGFDKVNGCNTCWCLSGGIACAEVTDCGEDDEEEDGLWWHTLLVASGGAVILLSAVVTGLLVVVCVVIRQNSYRHKRLQEVDFSIVDELNVTDVSFKKKQPDVFEMKGPVDDSEPTKA